MAYELAAKAIGEPLALDRRRGRRPQERHRIAAIHMSVATDAYAVECKCGATVSATSSLALSRAFEVHSGVPGGAGRPSAAPSADWLRGRR